MDIGKRLRDVRLSKGLSQHDLQERSGLFGCYISRVENGHTLPTLGTLQRMAKAVGIETYQLFFEGDGKPKAVEMNKTETSTTQETRLLETFRKLDSKSQRLAMAMIARLGRRR